MRLDSAEYKHAGHSELKLATGEVQRVVRHRTEHKYEFIKISQR